MLSLTRKTDYALISLAHLAQEPANCSSAREIASRYHMPLPLLMNVLKLLTQRGLARSVRGPRGGYTLASPASKITLKDIIGAVEGPIHLVRCIPWRDHDGVKTKRDPCELMPHCPVGASIHKVHHRLIRFLDEVTLADVACNSAVAKDGRATHQTSAAGA